MKKNRMMRAASALLVAVLLTTCTISGTFAKYTTSVESSDSARVAKFGVAITANGTTFAKEYQDTPENATVEVKSDVNVVAPGTGGSMASMTLTGTPEVAVKVSYVADFTLSDNWTVEGGSFYCPLKINVEGTEVNGSAYDKKGDFEAAVEALINGWTKTYDAGTDLSATSVDTDAVSVSWEWPFSVNDVNDTWLGNQAASGNPATVSLTIKTTVEQID